MTYGRKFWVTVGIVVLASIGLYLDKLAGAEWVTVIALVCNGYLFANVLQKRNGTAS